MIINLSLKSMSILSTKMCLGEQIRLVLSRIGKSTRIENLVSIGISIKIGVLVFSVDSKYKT
jgi:hypothetical protein